MIAGLGHVRMEMAGCGQRELCKSPDSIFKTGFSAFQVLKVMIL